MELLEQASAASVFGLHVAACRGELPARVEAPPDVWGKLIVYASRSVVTPDTTTWLDQGIRDVPHPGEVIRAGHPICTVLASGSTRSACEDALRSAAARIEAACDAVDQPIPADDLGDDE
jgi:predicted ATP-grasp superfamily ATP-dependent carboligase